MSSHPRLSSSSSEDGEENNGRELPHAAIARVARRYDNSISFRDFLQQQSDVIPSRNPRRPPPGRNVNSAVVPVPVDLVDIPGLLPDFVQDHLVVESQNIGDAPHENHPVPNAVSPLDLALINEMMPTLTNSSQRDPYNTNTGGDAAGLDELGAYGPVPSGPSLPDFLSDGPMHCDATGSSVSSDPQPRSGRFIPARCSTGSLGRSQIRGSSQNTDSLLHQIQRLEHDLQERDLRILELENVIFEQKAELVGLYEQIAQDNQENIAESEERRLPVSSSTPEGAAAIAVSSVCLSNGDGPSLESPPNSRRVQEVATRAERLLTELMKEMQQLKKGD